MKPFAKPPLIRLEELTAQDGHGTGAAAGKESGPGRKGRPWTAEEHLAFLQGLRALGKGNWKGISRLFLFGARTPTQVASHAQKHELRQAGKSCSRRKSRFTALECQAAALFAPAAAVPPLFRSSGTSSSDVASVMPDVVGEPVSAACEPGRGGCASAGAAPLPARPRPCRPRLCCAQAASAREDAAARLLQGLGRIAKGAGPAAQPTAAPAAAPPLLPSSASAFHSVSSPQ